MHYNLSNYGHCKNVNMFLTRKNIDVNLRNKASQTPILLTLDNDVIKKLIALGADVNVQDYSGKTPLHYACSKNDPELVDLLLSSGANVNIKDSLGLTPLIYCFMEVTWPSFNGPVHGCGYRRINRIQRIASYKTVKALLNNGAKINEPDKEGRSALNYAIIQNNQPVLLLLLSSGAKVSNETSVREKLLTNAIYGGNSEIVKWLLEEGFDPNQNYNDGKTILYAAAEVGTSKMVQDLILGGANPSVPSFSCLKCKSGKQISFPIHAAANTGNIEALEELLKNVSINVNIKDYSQQSPLHLAVEQDLYYNSYQNHREHLLRYTDCIELLLKNGADPNQVNQYGQTPLMLIKPDPYLSLKKKISRTDKIKIINSFANNCTDFNIRDANGVSVFMYISRCHNIKMDERMLLAGANINIKDNNGKTALDYALMYQNDLNRRKDENAKNIKGGMVYILNKVESQEDEIDRYINYLIKNGAKKGKDIN
ncbi:ankyrin repeat protein [Sporocytophaga myxococcoides]|uniref:Ankyrin repeat protein n=1 Tax=Sporocytophaga myxococcoides TaxID=153721 RepID=A0A098LEK7_9BACT|nr:ankyrin repeat protein [Sporocytophaga myxococcoides]